MSFLRRNPLPDRSRAEAGSMQSIPRSDTSSHRRSRDTGFPEPFCGSRNTTLPHPDADTSPYACISSEDVPMNRFASRHRRSLLSKNKRTIGHGRLTPETECMGHQDLSDSGHSSTGRDSDSFPTIPRTSEVRQAIRPPSGDGSDSLASTSTDDYRKLTNRHHHFAWKLSGQGSSFMSTSSRKRFLEKLGLSGH